MLSDVSDWSVVVVFFIWGCASQRLALLDFFIVVVSCEVVGIVFVGLVFCQNVTF